VAAEVASIPTVDRLNALPPEDARDALAVLFEQAPAFLDRLVAVRPFVDEADLFARAESIALGLPEREAVDLVNAHPRLGAPPASVSALSFREQGYDRPNSAEDDLAARLGALNDAYERTFGFRYCVFVGGRPREALIPEWEERLTSGDHAAELVRARRDVVAIARDRYRRLSGSTGGRAT
jgi:2-oxo-4-hydroxy-4-carboxy--5-ureidoimidazoline (OHCU) decarboxylase